MIWKGPWIRPGVDVQAEKVGTSHAQTQKRALRIQFDRGMELEFGANTTGNGRILVYQELDEVLDLMAMADKIFHDKRRSKNRRHTLAALARQATYGRLGGSR